MSKGSKDPGTGSLHKNRMKQIQQTHSPAAQESPLKCCTPWKQRQDSARQPWRKVLSWEQKYKSVLSNTQSLKVQSVENGTSLTIRNTVQKHYFVPYLLFFGQSSTHMLHSWSSKLIFPESRTKQRLVNSFVPSVLSPKHQCRYHDQLFAIFLSKWFCFFFLLIHPISETLNLHQFSAGLQVVKCTLHVTVEQTEP